MLYIHDISKNGDKGYIGFGFTSGLKELDDPKTIILNLDIDGNPN